MDAVQYAPSKIMREMTTIQNTFHSVDWSRMKMYKSPATVEYSEYSEKIINLFDSAEFVFQTFTNFFLLRNYKILKTQFFPS